jgi:hypothetical protein
VDHVLPDAPLRQWVITLPFEIRARLAYDAESLGAVSRTFVQCVLDWYRRRMSDRGIKSGKSGAVTVLQRVSSDLRINPRLHSLCLDGAFTQNDDSELTFHPLPSSPTTTSPTCCRSESERIIAMLRKKGVIAHDDESRASAVSADTALGDSEPALAELAVASAAGTLPAGPALRRHEPAFAVKGTQEKAETVL